MMIMKEDNTKCDCSCHEIKKDLCSYCHKEHPEIVVKCADCDRVIEPYWLETHKTRKNYFITHGETFQECMICDSRICERCYDDHAKMEAFG